MRPFKVESPRLPGLRSRPEMQGSGGSADVSVEALAKAEASAEAEATSAEWAQAVGSTTGDDRMRTIAVGAVMALLLLYVWERVDLVQVGYRIQQLKAERNALAREQDELRVRIARLTSPERLARVATEQLGMIRPIPGQVILVSLGAGRPAAASSSEGMVRVAQHIPIQRKP